MAITIQTYLVSNDLSEITLELELDADETVTSLLLWNQDSYKDPDQQVDLIDLADGTGNTESITISADDAGESSFTGLYMLEVQTSDGNAAVVGTASFTQYYKIQASFLATIDLSCLECNTDFQNALLLDLYLEGTKNAMLIGRFQDAIEHLEKLVLITEDSDDCEDCFDIEALVSTATNIVSVGIIDCQLTET
tara:strand:- start:319 stop:900 length:582 start_codon:yes stop_codon:yes gene_type:complete